MNTGDDNGNRNGNDNTGSDNGNVNGNANVGDNNGAVPLERFHNVLPLLQTHLYLCYYIKLQETTMAAIMSETEMATKMETLTLETITEMTMETETLEMIMEAKMVRIHVPLLSMMKIDDAIPHFSL